MAAKRIAHAALASLLLTSLGYCQEAPFHYRFQAGDSFVYLVAQESRPAQGPARAGGQLVYRFEVAEANEAGATLKVSISGRGYRGPDPESKYEEGRAGRAAEYSDLGVSFHLTPTGVPVEGEENGYQLLDHAALALAPTVQSEPGTPEWAIVRNTPQFFPFLGAGGNGREHQAGNGGTLQHGSILHGNPTDTPRA